MALRHLQPERCALQHGVFDPQAESLVISFLRAQLQPVCAAAQSLPLQDLVMEMQEDLVVSLRGEGERAEQARVGYVHVCFPTGWAPERILGLDFEQIHAPVPSHDHFTKAHEPNPDGRGDARARLSQSLFPSQPLLRHVWTVTPDPRLDRHPSAPLLPLDTWSSSKTAYLRVERQVIVPLDEHVSVFLIRIHVQSVAALPPAERDALQLAVSKMPSRIAAYKGLLADRQRILELISSARS